MDALELVVAKSRLTDAPVCEVDEREAGVSRFEMDTDSPGDSAVIPVESEDVEASVTSEIVETVGTVETVENVETVETVEIAEENTADIVEENAEESVPMAEEADEGGPSVGTERLFSDLVSELVEDMNDAPPESEDVPMETEVAEEIVEYFAESSEVPPESEAEVGIELPSDSLPDEPLARCAILEERLKNSKKLLKKQEESVECFLRQRDSAIGERNSLMDIVSRLNSEIDYLKEIHSKNSQQLKTTIDSNCEIVTKNGELKTKELSIKYREELLNQERSILDDKIKTLTSELNKSNLELETIKISQFSKLSTLEIQLAAKTEELSIADRDIAHLREERIKFIEEVENLNTKIVEQRDGDRKECNELRKKLSSKAKIADLYKSMRDDSDSKCKELMSGIAELQNLLKGAVEKYGDLESKNIQMQIENEAAANQKNESIKTLTDELESTKRELQKVKSESINLGLTYLSPTAAVAREFIKSGKTLSQIYCELVHVSDELGKKKEENSQLKEAFSIILAELEENAPLIRQHNLQYDDVVEDHSVLTRQIESMEMELNQLREDYSESIKIINHYERENKRLGNELNDLGQQVCFLLKEMEISRGKNVYSDRDLSNMSGSENSAYNLITRNLVTFGDIQEIQANNQKLLKLVRELSEKQEENDCLKDQIETGELQEKLQVLSSKVADLSAAKERQTKHVNELIKQRDMYKKLYHSKPGINSSKGDAASMDVDAEDCIIKLEQESNKPNDIKILETQLEENKKLLNQMREDHKKFEGMADSKEKLLLRQIDKLRKELSDLNDTYRKCYCSLESNNERHKILQSDLTNQKRKVAMFEERNEKYSTKIAELEMSMKYLQDKVGHSESKLTQADVLAKNLQKECKFLRDSNSSLLQEKDRLNSVIESQSILVSNLNVIKECVEKRGNDDKSRLEAKLEEFSRECSLLQKKLDEKQLSFSFQSQIKENNQNVEEIKLELINTKEELERKMKHIDELSSQEYSQSQNQALMENIKDLNNKLNERQCEINALQQQLIDHKKHTEKLRIISESAESEAKNINDTYLAYKQTTEREVFQFEKSIQQLKEKCFELETELSLQNNNQDELNNDLKTELSRTQELVATLTDSINNKDNDIAELNSKILELSTNLHQAEEKCGLKEALYAANNRDLNSCKEEIIDLYKEINELKNQNIDAKKQLLEQKTLWEEQKQVLISEKDSIEVSLSDLRGQNSVLLDQIDTLNSQIVLSQNIRGSDSLNDSMMSESMLNVSSEGDSRSVSMLMQIIKYLRKERDAHHSMYNTMQGENLKLKSELELFQKQIDDLKNRLSEKNPISSKNQLNEHSELIHKLETFNSISQSNKLLREERDSLLIRVNELSGTLSKLEESLSSLQERNAGLAKRMNTMVSENTSIQAECNRWKARVTTLSERANKTNPEDWKRLQNERETLGKMLTAERETIKKLRDEALISKLEKSKLEEQNNNLNKQYVTLTEENKKLTAEISSLKKESSLFSSELTELKANVSEKTEENKKLNESLANQLAAIAESKNKEMQLRKIAKQYRSQYEEASKALEETKKKLESETGQTSGAGERQQNATFEPDQKASDYVVKISDLETQISSTMDENSTLLKNIEELKSKSQEMEDKATQMLKQAKTKIILLTESKENLAKELQEANAKVEQFEQNKDEHSDMLAALKSQFEGRIAKMEKEKSQLQQDQQNEITQLYKVIDALTQNVGQKHVENQQTAKSSLGSVQGDKTTSEPPTANIKPMSGSQQPIGSRRLGNEPPLASIRPMSSVTGTRTAAVLPNVQYSVAPIHPHNVQSIAIVQSESASLNSGNTHVAEFSPSSSNVLQPSESTQNQEMESGETERIEIASAESCAVPQPTIQQTVALVSPRMETSAIDSPVTRVQSHSPNDGLSSTVTTSHEPEPGPADCDAEGHVNQKRIRVETDEENPTAKRFRGSECQPEYQVPTSSQKELDDSVIVVDSDDEEEDQGMYVMEEEEGDEVAEDEEIEEEEEEDDDDSSSASTSSDDDNVQNVEEEEDREDEQGRNEDYVEELEEEEAAGEEVVEDEEGYEENWQQGDDINNAGEVDDGNGDRNSEDQENEAVGTSQANDRIPSFSMRVGQPIETLSNYSANRSSNAFMRASGNTSGLNTSGAANYEEGDDGIVPSTPTLFVPSRNDGFGEAVRSPRMERNIDRDARFSFGNADSGTEGNVLENTQADLTNQLESRHSSNSDGSGLVIDINESGLNEDVEEAGETSQKNE